jgi:hypothetical protein
MSKINVTANEFADIVVSFLLDKLLNPDEVIPSNEDFDKYMEKMKLKGMKSVSLTYYLNLNTNLRVAYKRIKSVFEDDKSGSSVIYIYPNKKAKEETDKKASMVKRIMKKLLKKEDISKGERNLLVESFGTKEK